MKEKDISGKIDELEYLRCEIDRLVGMSEGLLQMSEGLLQHIYDVSCFAADDDVSRYLERMLTTTAKSLSNNAEVYKRMESVIDEGLFVAKRNMTPCVYGPPDGPDTILE